MNLRFALSYLSSNHLSNCTFNVSDTGLVRLAVFPPFHPGEYLLVIRVRSSVAGMATLRGDLSLWSMAGFYTCTSVGLLFLFCPALHTACRSVSPGCNSAKTQFYSGCHGLDSCACVMSPAPHHQTPAESLPGEAHPTRDLPSDVLSSGGRAGGSIWRESPGQLGTDRRAAGPV